mmetsp:Transcript_23735/g.40561  ORF Transcript_23735/g.40561 Transcript_23735/m.40561 type:complete len:737 (-) Transcript_23735:568-2778(-)
MIASQGGMMMLIPLSQPLKVSPSFSSTIMMQTVVHLLMVVSLFKSFSVGRASDEKDAEVKSILDKIERDALDFRDEMKRAYYARCNAQTLSECEGGNFYDCASVFPNQQCMAVDELVVSACGACNGWWDKTTSHVSSPAAVNLSDPDIIQTVCYSRLAEPYMVEKFKRDEQYWAKYNVYPSYTYFAAHNGIYRQIPGRHQKQCGAFDPRRRPWFVAASTGPKDVVLVIDTSDSMNRYLRLELAKQAAITIVNTLSVWDFVAIITFSDTASQVGGYTNLIRATMENKEILIDAINELEADGGTNFYDAFETAYNTLEDSIPLDKTAACNVAILFLTDGQITQGAREDDVINLVNNRTHQFATNHKRKKPIVFTYSLGDSADHDVTKAIACNTNGVWTPVNDYFGDLITTMSSYYKLFALGLGEGGNEDFAAWVEPYKFVTTGNMGTTVSVPLYDDTVSPPLFLGVVAIDIYMDALEQVLGEDSSSTTMLDRFIELSTARCPTIELSECELDALRDATCGVCNSTDYVGIVPEQCPLESDLPDRLFENTKMEGEEYWKRSCCSVDGFETSEDMCQASPPSKIHTDSPPPSGEQSKTILIISIVVPSVVILFFCVCCLTSDQRLIWPEINHWKANSKIKRHSTLSTETECNIELPNSVSIPDDRPYQSGHVPCVQEPAVGFARDNDNADEADQETESPLFRPDPPSSIEGDGALRRPVPERECSVEELERRLSNLARDL